MSESFNCPHCNAAVPLPAKKPSAATLRRLTRLGKERPDLLAKVEAGALSVSGACEVAGWVPKRTPFDQAVAATLRMSDEDLLAFGEWLQSDDFRERRSGRKGVR